MKYQYAIATFVGMLFVLPQNHYSQTPDIFEVNKQTSEIKRRFKLSAGEFKTIGPLITEANKSIVRIYARFGGEEPEYSDRVWREIVQRRIEFESGIGVDLSNRQKVALRAARSGMERRILSYLIDDYVGFLAERLDLDDGEFRDVHALFASESAKKYRSMSNNLANQNLLQKEIERISKETETRLQKILSVQQWGVYSTLSESRELVA